MPVIAIGAAIGAAVFAGSTVAAVGLTVVSALEVVAAVGATVSAVGAVTCNKALTYVGAGLGLVGGVGALASSAGVLGADAASGATLFGPSAAASTADTTAAAGADAATSAASSTSGDVIDSFAGNAGLQTLSDANPLTGAADMAGEPAAASGAAASFTPPPSSGSPDFVGINSTTQDAPTPTAGTATDSAPTGQVAPAAPTATPAPNLSMPPTGVTPAAGQLPVPPVTPGDVGGVDPVTGQTITAGVSPTTGQLIGLPDDNTGVLGNILDFVKKNQLLSYGAVQAGGQFLSGLTSTLTPANVAALNAQAAQNQAAANFTAQQTANLAGPRPIATLAPVTGTPGNIITPPTAGIINSAPAVNVTGVPA